MLRIFLYLIVFFLSILPANAQISANPRIEELREKFVLELPPYWNLDDFKIETSANYGSSVEPIIKSRFTAKIALNLDTFVEAGEVGKIIFLRPVLRVGTTRMVYGISTSEPRAGTWITNFELTNNPMVDVGNPRDFFPGRTIIRGTEEEREFYEYLKLEEEQQHSLKLSRLKQEKQLKEIERQTELEKIAHETQLKLTKQNEEQKLELGRLEAEAALQQKRNDELAEIQKKLKNDLKTRLQLEIPGSWNIVSLTIEAGANVGTVSEPVFKQRFNAEVELNTDTFVKDEKKDPYLFVIPVGKSGEQRVVHGVSTAHILPETRKIDLKLENDYVLQEIGLPLSYFPGKVIIRGSPEEQEYWQQVEATDEAKNNRELARRSSAERLEDQERQAKLARLAHETKLIEEKSKAEIAKLESEAQLREAKEKQLEKEKARARAKAELRLAELDTALKTGDSNKKRLTLTQALEDADVKLRSKALHYIISQTKTLSGVISKKKRIPFSLQIKSFNPQTGEISGEYHGSHNAFRRDQGFSGKVSGVNLGVAGKKCSISITLAESAMMEGTIECRGHFRSEYAAISLF
jgi:hypothetical protein